MPDTNQHHRLSRRQALTSAGLGTLGAGALVAFGAVPASADSGGADIVGSWDVLFTQTHPTPHHLQSLVVFASDGAVVEADGSAQSPSLGAWRRSEDGVLFSIKSWGFSPNGSLFGTVRVNCKVAVNEGSVQGTFHITVRDTHGVIIFQGNGTLSGSRFDVTFP
jgi:hypothetical protein